MEHGIKLFGHEWPEHRQAFICDHVFEGEPICIFFHEPDSDLVFLCGRNENHKFKFKVAGLNHLLEHHPEIATIPTVQAGEWAQKEDHQAEWTVGKLD